MSEKQNDLPNDDKREESSSLKAKDVVVPAAMLASLSACGGGGGSSSAGGSTSSGTGSATSPALPPSGDPTQPQPADGRITIDPVTRIEGHLRLETEIKNGQVASAWSSGMLFRGIETILKGRNPEDAWLFTQRLCGVCTYVHGETSVRCVENALGITVPSNARIVRNLLMGAQFLQDHIVHFYHLSALDWVDITAALSADPAATASLAATVSPGAPLIDFAASKNRLQTLVSGGQLGIFAGGYWPHEAYLLTPEENLLLAAHYLEALKLQAKAARMHAIFGGKNPHVQSLKVGGVTCSYDINAARIVEFRAILDEVRGFVDSVYLPDAVLVAQAYPEWAGLGATHNLLAYGEFPQTESEPASLYLPQGVILNRGAVAPLNTSDILEHVRHSWYEGEAALQPASGVTAPMFTARDTADRYSWLKAPRYQGEPVEVGPLARVMVAYGMNHPEIKAAVDGFLQETGLTLAQMYSTIGRIAARAIETQVIAGAMGNWLGQLQPGGSVFQSWSMPASASGCGLNEAPRGAVGHWLQIQNGAIGNYQLVVPSTWNLGPRCSADKPGPVESALVGTPVVDPKRPVEILRTVHSFDPCIACAVHVIDPRENQAYVIRTP
jgi:[NiFe] hydrogenase large subunit